MRLSACIIFGWLALLTAGPIHAANAPNMVQGVDASPLFNYLHPQIYTTTVPLKMFHYLDGKLRLPGKFSADDPRGYDYIKYNAVQWAKRLGQFSFSLTGTGLYLASDPVASHDLGNSATWTLLEIEIPVGFRVIHAWSDELMKIPDVPDSAVNVLTKFGCRGTIHTMLDLFSTAQYTNSPKCVAAVLEVFEKLKLDAFSYAYGGGYLNVCVPASPKGEHGRAFVIMSDRWLKPGTVRVFNAQTADARDERLLIESTIFKSSFDYVNRSQNASVPSGLYYINLSDPGEVPSSYPAVIDVNKLAGYAIMDDGTPIYWPDLQGVSTDPDIDKWIQSNFFGCSDKPQYQMDAQ